MSSALTTPIAGLCSAEASVRESAAAEIYAVGRASAEHSAKSWLSDAELSALLLGPKPEATVGLAVQRETFSKIRTANSVSRLADVPSDQDAEEFELHFSNGVSLDILTSRAPGGEGALARYLGKCGEGVQQVEFRCSNVGRATEILKEKFGSLRGLSGDETRRGWNACEFFPYAGSRRRQSSHRIVRIRGKTSPEITHVSLTISLQARRISPTVHAWAMQPRGVCGGSPSKISASVPRPYESMWLPSGSR